MYVESMARPQGPSSYGKLSWSFVLPACAFGFGLSCRLVVWLCCFLSCVFLAFSASRCRHVKPHNPKEIRRSCYPLGMMPLSPTSQHSHTQSAGGHYLQSHRWLALRRKPRYKNHLTTHAGLASQVDTRNSLPLYLQRCWKLPAAPAVFKARLGSGSYNHELGVHTKTCILPILHTYILSHHSILCWYKPTGTEEQSRTHLARPRLCQPNMKPEDGCVYSIA